MSKLLFDYDPLLYAAGFKGETRSVKVVHQQSGDEYEFSTRTDFWGHHKKRAGGWLAEYNAAKAEDNRRHPDEFIVTDVQVPGPIEECLHTLKMMIRGHKEVAGAKTYYGYTGKGTVFREDVSTVLKYKGNREGVLRPVHLDAMKDYLIKNHGCKVVTGIEADDACTMDLYDAYKVWLKTKSDDDKVILAFSDKDYWQCAGHLYHTDSGKFHSQGDIFGKLFIVEGSKGKKDVKGYGRLWLYFQVMNGDDADNYCANSANPAMKWAQMSAYNVLKDATNDKEAFEALISGYKTLYPSPKKIIGWRGYEDPKDRTILKPDAQDFEIEVDWLYMLQENFTLAKMLRWHGDKVLVTDVMNKLGVKYE